MKLWALLAVVLSAAVPGSASVVGAALRRVTPARTRTQLKHHGAHHGHLRMLNAKVAPEAPAPANDTAVATQSVRLFNKLDCEGNSTPFEFSGNEFLQEFTPYVHNLWSAKLCGKGTFFYFSSPDMQTLSTLGHITRCGDVKVDGCICENLPMETRSLVESFTIQYC
eukprot:SRR837773.13486.p2 GENE.SRR837773.13486~~SRR837773.13486.p2  ORF type:complete len:178 (-),score=59.66 SRR837773.13486:37-537(-)